MSRYIVAGGRDFQDEPFLRELLDHIISIDRFPEIISGMAAGADALGAKYAENNNIMLHEFPAEWDKYSKSAGYKRNVEMAQFASYGGLGTLIAFWDGKSKGTKHMIDIALEHDMEVHIYRY